MLLREIEVENAKHAVDHHVDQLAIAAAAVGTQLLIYGMLHIQTGDTLVVIEDAEFRLALAQAEAAVKGQKSGTSAVSAGMSTTHSNVRVASAGIDEARIQMENAQKDYLRFEQLL